VNQRLQLSFGSVHDALRFMSPTDPALRWSARLVIALWIYAALLTVLVIQRWLIGSSGDLPAFALLVPPQAVLAMLLFGLLRHGKLSPTRFMGWSLLMGATVFDLLGAVDWSYIANFTNQPFGTVADLLYMINYALLACASVVFFVSCGGSLNRPKVWVDAAIIGFAVVASLLPLLFSPLLEPRPAYIASASASLGYALGIGFTMTGLALLLMQISDWRRDAGMVLFIAGISIAMLTDVVSIAANVRGYFELGNFDHLFWVWADAFGGTAMLLERQRDLRVDRPRDGERRSTSFLPVLAILVSLVVVLGAGKHHSGFSQLTVAVLLVSGAALIVARQLGVGYEFGRLNAELAQRQAEARFTELVRRSADMIVVVTVDGIVSYASPAAVFVAGCAPETLVGTRAHDLLGPSQAARLTALLQEAVTKAGDPAEIELRPEIAAGRRRAVQVIASNELSNPLIKGIVLTVRDVTEQRSTEREVLDVAARERQRFAAEVHEGIGQDLVGMTLMLKGLSVGSETDTGSVRDSLVPLVEQMNRMVASARGLARGLSPLTVVQGSLTSALKSMAAEIEAGLRISVRVRCDDIPDVGAAAAEHLHYIAREAVARAARDKSCKCVDIELRAMERGTKLAIWDDSLTNTNTDEAVDELPLRLIAYRARLIGGSLSIRRLPGAGTWIEVTVPPAS
jgi:PAS domain S-box-containing protein